jgi:hypothetical protein
MGTVNVFATRESGTNRHVHALRWTGQTRGYAPPNDDAFLNHAFGPHWIEATFE